MDYEKGAPRNLVQFSEYNDLAFTDTGTSINDNAKANKNVLWSSDKIEKRISEIASGRGQAQASQPVMSDAQYQYNIHGPGGSSMGATAPGFGKHNKNGEYYTNGFKRLYHKREPGHRYHYAPRVLKPSWWLSFIIPRRSHYCNKCNNYMEHKWATSWKDDVQIAPDCVQGCASKHPSHPPTRIH